MITEPAIDVKWKKKERRMELFFLALVVVIIAFVAMISSGGLKSSSFAVGPTTTPAKFVGTVIRITLIDAHSVSVKYLIKNSGHSSGTPNCTLIVQDPSGSFPGYNATIITRSIQAGHKISSKMSVPVAGPGPQYITQGKINCN